MASLYIKDPDTVAVVARLAKRTGQTKTALVRQLAADREAELDRESRGDDFDRKLADFYRRFPPLAPVGPPSDKAFFDRMWGEPD